MLEIDTVTVKQNVITFPVWITKLSRRLLALEPGRYQILLTVDQEYDWTVVKLGKVEKSQG